MMADKSLADPNLDFADFAKGGLAYATQADGRIDSLPFNLDPWVVYYNKELFEAKGIAYPKTLRRDGRRGGDVSTTRRKGVSGFVARGLKNANVPVWSSFLLGYGGAFLDANGKLLTDTAEAVDAAKMYQTLLAQIGAAGRRGIQLERGAEPVPPGQGGDVARRHRLRATARGSRPSRASSARSAMA